MAGYRNEKGYERRRLYHTDLTVLSHGERVSFAEGCAFCREGREPRAEETQAFTAYLERHAANVQRAYEDIFWSIINTKEFLYNH